jgi:exodeoxyribonuclease VII small subunit
MAKNKKRKFEEAFKELEEIVLKIEEGELPLEDAIEKYEKGVKALKECYTILSDAEKKIELLVKDLDGTLKTQPFDSEESGENK